MSAVITVNFFLGVTILITLPCCRGSVVEAHHDSYLQASVKNYRGRHGHAEAVDVVYGNYSGSRMRLT